MGVTKTIKELPTTLGRRWRRVRGTSRPEDAAAYVGTNDESGRMQCELLKREGCVPTSKVLEVGCGALHAGVYIMRYVEPGNFAGLDPNEWLREAAMKDPEVGRLVREKQPKFLTRFDFDASELGMKFDFVLSHSILSHAAHWQLGQYLGNCAKVLSPTGKIVASLRLAEGNAFGQRGSRDGEDTKHPNWRYPGGVWFKRSTVDETAAQLGLTVEVKPEFTESMVQVRPSEVHDWIVVSRRDA